MGAILKSSDDARLGHADAQDSSLEFECNSCLLFGVVPDYHLHEDVSECRQIHVLSPTFV